MCTPHVQRGLSGGGREEEEVMKEEEEEEEEEEVALEGEGKGVQLNFIYTVHVYTAQVFESSCKREND